MAVDDETIQIEKNDSRRGDKSEFHID